MHRLFPTFPRGWPGVGLLFLRGVVGLVAAFHGLSILSFPDAPASLAWAVGASGVLGGVALVVGLVTPVAAVMVAIGGVVLTILHGEPGASSQAAVLVVAMSVAVVMLGPGAYSLDARMFGRREIVVTRKNRVRE